MLYVCVFKHLSSIYNDPLYIHTQLVAEKERSLNLLQSKCAQQDQLLRKEREGHQLARSEAEGLGRELRERERDLGSQSAEMTTLSEQLTDVGRKFEISLFH